MYRKQIKRSRGLRRASTETEKMRGTITSPLPSREGRGLPSQGGKVPSTLTLRARVNLEATLTQNDDETLNSLSIIAAVKSFAIVEAAYALGLMTLDYHDCSQQMISNPSLARKVLLDPESRTTLSPKPRKYARVTDDRPC